MGFCACVSLIPGCAPGFMSFSSGFDQVSDCFGRCAVSTSPKVSGLYKSRAGLDVDVVYPLLRHAVKFIHAFTKVFPYDQLITSFVFATL